MGWWRNYGTTSSVNIWNKAKTRQSQLFVLFFSLSRPSVFLLTFQLSSNWNICPERCVCFSLLPPPLPNIKALSAGKLCPVIIMQKFLCTQHFLICPHEVLWCGCMPSEKTRFLRSQVFVSQEVKGGTSASSFNLTVRMQELRHS